MLAFVSNLFDTSGFPARLDCGTAWKTEPGLAVLHIAGDLATFLAYFAVPFVAAYFLRGRTDVKLPRIFWIFLGLVFFSCGVVHLIEAIIFFAPVYRLSAVAKILTAFVSCIGVVVLIRVIPRMLSLKTPDELAREISERKQAESHLQTERHLLHTLLNHLPDLIYFKDANLDFIRISHSLAKRLGLSDPTTAIGKSDEEFFPPDYAEQARRDEQELMRTGEPLVAKEENPTWPNGETQWVLTTKIPLIDVHDKIIGLCGISHDITKRKQNEQALRTSEERFDLAVRGSSDGIWDWNVLTNEVYFSGRFKELLGFSDREFQNVFDSWKTRLHPADADKTMNAIREHLENNKPYDAEYRLRTKSGEYRWYRARGQALWDDSGKPFRMAGSITDVTQHKAAAKALQERAQVAALAADVGMALTRNLNLDDTLQEIVEAMVHHLQAAFARIWLLEEAENVLTLRASAGMYTHLDGAHSRIPVGQYKIGWIAAEGKAHLTNQVIGDPRVSDQEWAQREGMVAFAGYPLKVDNQLIGVAAMFARHALPDETTKSLAAVSNAIAIGVKRKQTQAALRKAKEAAEAANRAKSDFLANMSHEIRTPMNAVIGLTELVLGTALTPLQRDYLTTVLEAAESLLALINQVLDFSKIEAGKLELEIAPFRIREQLGDAMKALGLRAHKKKIELIFDIAPDVPERLLGDGGRLRQIVINLVGNAIKFTESGEIVVRILCRSREDDAAELHFSVSDTGIGVLKEKLNAIFEAFEQGDASTTRRYGGTGLGLAISSQLVKQMAGEIWVESEVGRGSTFHFTALFGVKPDGNSKAVDTSILDGVGVLVVDDNATNRRILQEMLASWRLKALTVENAQQAIAILRQRQAEGAPIDIVLTDVQMPDVDGYMLTEQIRNHSELRDVVVITLTSGSRNEDYDRGEKLGIAAQLIKPVKQSELLNAMLEALSERSSDKSQPADEPPPISSPTSGLHILLAEDGLANQKLAVGLLKKWGHSVVVANNGLEAIAKSQQEKFDVVLMDIQMPELDGLEATQRIRERERATGNHLPIIALTARAMSQDRDLCLAAGMDDYLSKPFRQGELEAALGRVLAE